MRKQPLLLFVGGNLGPPSAKYVENRIKIDGSAFDRNMREYISNCHPKCDNEGGDGIN